MLSLLVLVPWIEGGANLRIHFALYVGVIVALAIWLWQLWQSKEGGSRMLVFAAPPLFAIVIGLIQYCPLPSQLLFLIAPATASLRERLLPAVLETIHEPTQSFAVRAPASTISLYPAVTWTTIGELSVYLATFLLACRRFRNRDSQRWLCVTALLVGGTIAFYGIAKDLSTHRAQGTDGVTTTSHRGFGPFADRDSAGVFLILCFAPALGLVLHLWQSRDRKLEEGAAIEVASVALQTQSSPLAQFGELAGKVSPRVLASATGTLLIALGILASGSRAALAASAGATAITLVLSLCAARRSRRVWVTGAVAIAGSVLVLLFASGVTWGKRSAGQSPEPHPATDALSHGGHYLAALGDFWLTGSGLGTHRYLHAIYAEHPTPELAYPGNAWGQTMIEAGVWGLLALLALIGLVAGAAWKITIEPSRGRRSPFAWSAIFLVAGLFVLSFFNNSYRTPANALWLSVVLGSIAGGAVTIWESKVATSDRSRRGGTRYPFLPLLAPCLIILSGLGSLQLLEVNSSNQALAAAQAALEQDTSDVPSKVQQAINQLSVASENRWNDARLHEDIAITYIACYRAETGLEPDDAGRTELADDAPMENEKESMLRSLLPAVVHLLAARQSCPLLPRVHLHLAELKFLLATSWSDLNYLECADRLAQSDPDVLFRVGVLHWKAGRNKRAEAAWNRSLLLDPSRRDAIRGFMERMSPDPAQPVDAMRTDP